MIASNKQPDTSVDVRDFLGSVVPWSGGYVTIHWKVPGVKWFHGHSFQTIDAALQFVADLKNTQADIYFCLSSQKLNSGKRSRKHAIALLVVPVDIDVAPDDDKKYSNLSEAIAALLRCCIHLGIPRPSFLVRSGGGVHAYWLSDRPLTVAEWQPFADALKAALRNAGLKFDAGVTGDAARVLRVPGTFNWKKDKPRPVRLLQSSFCSRAAYDFAVVFKKILGESPGGRLRVADAFEHLPVTPLGDGIGFDKTLLPVEPILAECGWLRHVHDTGGIDQSEPLWRDALRVCLFLEKGESLIHEFSKEHEGYDYDATEAKFDRARQDQQAKDLGWPQCQTICDHGSEHCKTCPHLAEGKSPLNLARPETKTPAAAATTIRIVKGEIARVVDEAEAALLAVVDAAPIMVRAGMLVQPIVDRLPASHGRKTEVVLLRRLTAANLIYLLNKHAATFVQYDGRSKTWLKTDPTPAIATQLLEKGRWQFPKVAGVTNAPTLRPDGTILDSPGYDPATQLWYHPDSQLVLPQLCAAPTREQAEQALKLLTDLLTGYPFDSNVDRSVALAAILTPVLRGAFDVVPMNLLRAPDAGTGKSYLVDLVSIIARGQLCPVVTDVKSIEEMEKRLGALVLEGASMASLDNCSSDIGGDLLCQITERRLIYIRILGLSRDAGMRMARRAVRDRDTTSRSCSDMARRGLTANLDAKVERPELREFSFDPIERVLADRGSYIAAAITIARAYITAGGPKVCGPLGSYEQWSRLVRSPLIWLGQADPTKSMDEAREEDPVRRAEQDLIMIWRTQLGAGATYTAAALIKKANQRQTANHFHESGWAYPQLRELLVQQAGTPHGDIDAQRVGNWLMSIRGRVYDGYCIERVKEARAHGNTYALVKPQKRTPGDAPTSEPYSYEAGDIADDGFDDTLKELLSRPKG